MFSPGPGYRADIKNTPGSKQSRMSSRPRLGQYRHVHSVLDYRNNGFDDKRYGEKSFTWLRNPRSVERLLVIYGRGVHGS